MKPNKFTSFFRLITITIQRYADHFYRRITGLPQMKRSMITPQLYVGGQYARRAVDDLERIGITGVVNMRMHSIHKDMNFSRVIKICNLPTRDLHAPTQEDLIKGVDFITEEIKKNGKVYIHCRQGEGRGPTMAIAYLMSTGLTFEDAFSHVQKVRTFIRPTQEQIEALLEFEEYLKKKNTSKFPVLTKS